MRLSYCLVSLSLIAVAGMTKDWHLFAAVSLMVLVGIADQFLDAYKNRVVNVRLPARIVVTGEDHPLASTDGGGDRGPR